MNAYHQSYKCLQIFQFSTFYLADNAEMLKLCRVTIVKVFFLVLVYIFNFWLIWIFDHHFGEGSIADSLTKVHGLSVQYRTGVTVLMERGAQLSAVSQRLRLNEFCCFLEQLKEKHSLAVITWDCSDFPILLNALSRSSLLDTFLSFQVILLDSLKLISMEIKQKYSPLMSS